MTMSYDLFNSGLKRLKTPCIIHIMVFCISCKNFVFCVSEILTNFSTQKVGIVHIPWGLYIFQNGFHIDKSYRACRCVCTFALKPHYLKFIFILFFFTQNHWSSLCSIPQFSDSRSLWHTLVEISGKLSGYWCSNPRFIKSF